MPYYHAVKLLLLVWLQSPAYEGAVRVYLEGLRPWLARVQPQLDDFLAALLRSLVGRGAGAHRAAQPAGVGVDVMFSVLLFCWPLQDGRRHR